MRPERWLFTILLRLRSLFRWAQADEEIGRRAARPPRTKNRRIRRARGSGARLQTNSQQYL